MNCQENTYEQNERASVRGPAYSQKNETHFQSKSDSPMRKYS